MWTQSRIKVKPRCRFPKQRFQRYLQSKQTKNKLSFSAEGLSKLLIIGVQEALCTHTPYTLPHRHPPPHRYTSQSTHIHSTHRYTAPHTHPNPGAPTEAVGMLWGQQQPAPPPPPIPCSLHLHLGGGPQPAQPPPHRGPAPSTAGPAPARRRCAGVRLREGSGKAEGRGKK